MTYRTQNAAELGAFLARRTILANPANLTEPLAETVARLQRVARSLHRNAERACNEDCGCSHCRGEGARYYVDGARVQYGDWRKAPESVRTSKECHACAGSGQSFGKREAGLMRRLREALAPYRVRVYEQGDPRGWPLYLIPEESGPASEDSSHYSGRGTAVCPH